MTTATATATARPDPREPQLPQAHDRIDDGSSRSPFGRAGSQRVHTVLDSPVGSLTLLAIDGALAGLYMDDQRHHPPAESFGSPDAQLPDAQLFDEVAGQLEEYFDGTRTTFDLPLAPAGTPFQQTVWAALRTIPYGQTVSYGELAEALGRPGAARAVGAANGRNPIGIVIPCHRVIGASGGLTGYGGGLDRKRFLLALEQGRAARGERLF